MSIIFWLFVLLVFAAAAVIFTLVFVALADRSLARGSGRRAGSRQDEETRNDGKDGADDETQPQPRDQDDETEGERNS